MLLARRWEQDREPVLLHQWHLGLQSRWQRSGPSNSAGVLEFWHSGYWWMLVACIFFASYKVGGSKYDKDAVKEIIASYSVALPFLF